MMSWPIGNQMPQHLPCYSRTYSKQVVLPEWLVSTVIRHQQPVWEDDSSNIAPGLNRLIPVEKLLFSDNVK